MQILTKARYDQVMHPSYQYESIRQEGKSYKEFALSCYNPLLLCIGLDTNDFNLDSHLKLTSYVTFRLLT